MVDESVSVGDDVQVEAESPVAEVQDDSSTDAQEVQPQAEVQVPAPEPKPNTAQHRIMELARKHREAELTNAGLQQQLAAIRQQNEALLTALKNNPVLLQQVLSGEPAQPQVQVEEEEESPFDDETRTAIEKHVQRILAKRDQEHSKKADEAAKLQQFEQQLDRDVTAACTKYPFADRDLVLMAIAANPKAGTPEEIAQAIHVKVMNKAKPSTPQAKPVMVPPAPPVRPSAASTQRTAKRQTYSDIAARYMSQLEDE